MDYKEINRNVMNDTQNLCKNINSLKNAISASLKNEYIILQEDEVHFDPNIGEPSMTIGSEHQTEIIVTKNRTFEAAKNYSNLYPGKKICCLDFANNHAVGGAPWSAGAQEESICRISTLYPCLYAKKNEYYEKHKKEFDSGTIDKMGTDDLIYIPDVVVFKTDESVPVLMDEDDWFKTDIIVSAAPVLAFEYDEKRYKAVMEKRIKRILDAAFAEGVQILILGAFGCGAFHNPPENVSEIFAKLLKYYNFETVEFAVFCRDDTKNYDVFCGKLGQHRYI